MNWNICTWGKFFDKSENFLLLQLFRKFRKFYSSGHLSVPISIANGESWIFPIKSDEFQHLQMETLPIWENRKIIFQNFTIWNISSWENFSEKSENFPFFHFSKISIVLGPQTPRHISTHTPPLKKKSGKKNRYFWWICLGNVPPL